ncbi:MAG: RNA methyltransferase [Pirellulaceae bacterium]
MQRIAIEDFDDPQLAAYRDLPRRAAARESGKFIVEGRWLVERLLTSRCEVESILVAERHAEEIAELAGEMPVTMFTMTQRRLEETVGFRFHRGMLACGRRPPSLELESVLSADPATLDSARPLTLVACADIDDPENLGGILRNCAAFGVDAVLTGQGSADPFSRRALRVSMGASLKLPIVEADDLGQLLQQLRDRWQVETAAAVLDEAAEQLPDFGRSRRTALVFGNEGQGLSPELLAHCDRRVTLPMRLGTDSLNVAVASGIFLYHVTR